MIHKPLITKYLKETKPHKKWLSTLQGIKHICHIVAEYLDGGRQQLLCLFILYFRTVHSSHIIERIFAVNKSNPQGLCPPVLSATKGHRLLANC